MGNFRQHLGFATLCGALYSVGSAVFAGLHWAYATVALLLTSMGGLLPDLDSASGVGLRGFTGLLGVLASLLVWRKMSKLEQPPGFEFHLWAVIAAYVLVRYGLRRAMVRFAVHRGMNHSIPTGAVWGAVTYLCYPTDHHEIRVAMASAVMLGFLSHLLLDEMCSVDLQGARVNKAFGTALKFWAPSPVATISVYMALSLLCWKIVRHWPDETPNSTVSFAVPGPDWPYAWPRSWFQDGFKDFRVFAKDQIERLPERVEEAKAYTAKELEELPKDLDKAKSIIARQAPETVEEIERAAAGVKVPESVRDLKKTAAKSGLPTSAEELRRTASRAGVPTSSAELKRAASRAGVPTSSAELKRAASKAGSSKSFDDLKRLATEGRLPPSPRRR